MKAKLFILAVSFIAAAILSFSSAIAYAAHFGTYLWTDGHAESGSDRALTEMFLAEGCTRSGFDTWLCILNPGTDEGEIAIHYMLFDREPVIVSYRIEPASRHTILVNSVVGEGNDVGFYASSTVPVLMERAMYFNYHAVWTGGHVEKASDELSDEWIFAEGCTREGFDTWLCIVNPGSEKIAVEVGYLPAGAPSFSAIHNVDPFSRYTVSVNHDAGSDMDLGIALVAESPVFAERSMYFDYNSRARGGSVESGFRKPEREHVLAEGCTREGFDTWICIANPSSETTDLIMTYLICGEEPVISEYSVMPNSRLTLSANNEVGKDRDLGFHIVSNSPVAVERSMYFDYSGTTGGGSCESGILPSASAYLAEGCTRRGFDTWLCLANPNAEEARVTIRYMTSSSEQLSKDYLLKERSRLSLLVNIEIGEGYDVGMKIESNVPVAVERSVYFSYSHTGSDTNFLLAEAIEENVTLSSPIRYPDITGIMYHEASATYSSGKPANSLALQPFGGCLKNENASNAHALLIPHRSGNPYYWIEKSRSRGTYSTSAVDVGAKSETEVFAPVSGTVVEATRYLLYNRYPDYRVRIALSDSPQTIVAVLHIKDLSVSSGDNVIAGVTRIGSVNSLSDYFQSSIGMFYTREEGNHVHLQINRHDGTATNMFGNFCD